MPVTLSSSMTLEHKMRKYIKSLKRSLCLKFSNSIPKNLHQDIISTKKKYIQKDADFSICKVVKKVETHQWPGTKIC